MKLQRLPSPAGQVLDRYRLTQDGDWIVVGMSGGKGSLTLLYVFYHLQRSYLRKYGLQVTAVDLGLENMNLELVRELCREFGIPYIMIPTEIGKILFGIRKEFNPCFLCVKVRKDALNEKAKELGRSKVAYTYHRDDVIETMLMSLFYEGRSHSFSPYIYLDRMDLTTIRSLLFATEVGMIGFRNKYQLLVCKNPCLMDGYTKRQYAKELIQDLQQDNPHLRDCLLHVTLDGSIRGWSQAPR